MSKTDYKLQSTQQRTVCFVDHIVVSLAQFPRQPTAGNSLVLTTYHRFTTHRIISLLLNLANNDFFSPSFGNQCFILFNLNRSCILKIISSFNCERIKYKKYCHNACMMGKLKLNRNYLKTSLLFLVLRKLIFVHILIARNPNEFLCWESKRLSKLTDFFSLDIIRMLLTVDYFRLIN